MAFQAGDFVGVVCEVQPGPFSDERLVTLDTIDGPISGFVKETELRVNSGKWEVRGKVQEVRAGTLKVLIFGSFFTTNGTAHISTSLAMVA